MFHLEIFAVGLYVNLVSQAICGNDVDQTGLKRLAGKEGFAYANFAEHKFRYLNTTPLTSISVNDPQECDFSCLLHSSCYSFNKAILPDIGQKILCELLQNDKYNESNQFLASQEFHHYSIENPCKSSPCKSAATCLAKYEVNDYQCACTPGYTGKNCEVVICPVISSVANGVLDPTTPATTVGSTVRFSCNLGYVLRGASLITCLADGSWSGNISRCDGFPPIRHWKLNGTDTDINLHGAAKYNQQDGRTVLFLDGSHGTYADTPAFPLHSINWTIAVWIKLMVQSQQPPIYGDWSSPHSFRLYIKNGGSLCLQTRDVFGGDLIVGCTSASDIIPVNRWSHVATTWNRGSRKMRLFVNGEMRLERTVAANRNLNFKNTGHSVYDIGLKRDGGNVAHAYYSDLMVFDHEFQFSNSENINNIKNGIFLNHPLSSFV